MLTTQTIELIAIAAQSDQSIAKIVVKSEYSKMPKKFPQQQRKTSDRRSTHHNISINLPTSLGQLIGISN
jgi:hypothetical protein